MCNNSACLPRIEESGPLMLNARMTQTRRILVWLMLIALAALVSYISFRGYLTPELLFNFANSFSC